jgi:Putative papain-like cysteine peptidase (DUF1796)
MRLFMKRFPENKIVLVRHIVMMLVIFLNCFLNIGGVYAYIEELEPLVLAAEDKPLFVSLGSYCEPAQTLRYGNMRYAAFPFDWIMSLDGDALIEILNDDFALFFDEEFVAPYVPATHLLHFHYHLEFLHDGDFQASRFADSWKELKTKYQRRIDRFRKLNEYKGKVYFIRHSFAYSDTDPHRYFHYEDNVNISPDYAMRLYEALKNRFSKLNFKLIIVNPLDREGLEAKELLDGLLEIKIYLYPNINDTRDAFIDFINALN